MELIIVPLIGLFGMYVINKQDKKKSKENFESLPNIDIPNKNYPDEFPVVNAETDSTSQLSTQNRYDDPNVYTDKYFKETNTTDSSPSKYTSLTGQPVDLQYFRHNNMAPYFGSKSHSNNLPNSTESTLDNLNGSGSQFISKKEQSPMFSPGENNDWAFGMPSNTDFIQSRVNASNKMANVKPFESIQVGPGLGIGPDIIAGNNGFNNGMMARDKWVDKNVDELRVVNKQKATGLGMLGYEGPAKSYVTERGSIGAVEKNRVNKTFEMGQDRLFTTTGIEKGYQLRPNTIERHVNRPETTTDYVGVAGYSNSAMQMEGTYMPCTNNELGPVPILPAYAAGKSGGYDADYGIKSNYSYPNNRSTTLNDNSYFGVVGGAFGSAIAPLLDILRPSRRENTIGNLRPYQNAKTSVANSYVYNPNDQPNMTNRQSSENSKNHMNIKGNQSGGYEITGVTEPHNAREITSDIYYGGNAKSGNSKPRTYDAEYNQRNNGNKSSTINGRLVPGNMKLMNSDVNITSKNDENLLLNNRPVDGKFASQIPDIKSMGFVQGQYSLYSGSQLDRSDGSIMNQLNDNPYNLNIINGI
jgi:hypothetical protein